MTGIFECPCGICTPTPPPRVCTGDAEASLPIPAFETLTEAPETSTRKAGEGWLPPREEIWRDRCAWGGELLQERELLLLKAPYHWKPRALGDGERFGRVMDACLWLSG